MEQRNSAKSDKDCEHQTISKRPCISSTCQPLALPYSHLLHFSVAGS
uniref:F-box protein n=1 Tax=Rhizophora mucronata TaxID=61149 RepID=A0A2P2PJJ0_RHIMU